MKNELVRVYNVPTDKICVVNPRTKKWLKSILETYREVAGGTEA